jgi:tetratricopeptide (TPR) repeat protein
MRSVFLALVLLSAAPAFAQSTAQSLFEKGNAAYQQDSFASALTYYLKIPEQAQKESAGLYYNLGNTYYKLGNLGKAILYYERALQLNPNDEEARQNLAIAKEKTIDRFDELPKTLVRNAYLGLLQLFSPNGWAVVSVVGFSLLLLGLGLYLFSRWGRAGFVTAFAGLLLGTLALLLAFGHQNYRATHRKAIVLSASAYVKSGPSQSAEDVLILHEGTAAIILQSFEGWRKIRLPDGKLGWIPAEDIEAV